jgi:phosphoglycerol transferase MdoB-like AlkP superfamily enzyme
MIFLLKTFLWTMLVFIIAKVVFMLACHEGHIFTIADLWQVILHGLTLDISTALYILAVPFLLTMMSVWYKPRWMGITVKVFFGIVAFALALAFIADTSLYPFWGFKLDASCLQYLETPTEAAASVSTGYLIARLIVLAAIAAIIYKGFPDMPDIPDKTDKAGLQGGQSLFHCIRETILYLLLIPVIIIGIRGGFDESTTNVGQVYFSQDQFLNHSAVNPVFNFLSSFEKTASNIVDYDYYTQAECDQLMKGLYPTTSVDSDTLLTTTRPNIVIILMESAGEVFAQAMPRLQQLKKEGIDFADCYANSWRTDRGTVCTYSGYPSFPTSSVMKMPKKSAMMPSIASSLRQEGYQTHYLYGGDINFTNMRGYLIATGWEQLTWKADYTLTEQNTAEWGVRDGITFETLYQMITRKHASPFLFGFSTLSTHQPWDVPIHQYDDEILNAFYYLDQCIGDFVERLRKTPEWNNLLLIFLPDHSMDFGDCVETVQLRNKIPMVWAGGAVKEPRRIEATCNQTDLVATLLAQMRLPYDKFPWSRDVLSKGYQYPFAVHNYNNGFSLVDSTGYMVYDLDSRKVIANKSSDSPRLVRMGKAILQATTKDLKEK